MQKVVFKVKNARPFKPIFDASVPGRTSDLSTTRVRRLHVLDARVILQDVKVERERRRVLLRPQLR